MKSVIMASVIIIIIVVLVVLAYFYIDYITHYITQTLDKNEKFVAKNDWDLVENETEKLKRFWKDNRTLVSIISTHTIIDEIDYAIEKTITAAKRQDSSDFYRESQTLRFKIQVLKEHQEISVANLF